MVTLPTRIGQPKPTPAELLRSMIQADLMRDGSWLKEGARQSSGAFGVEAGALNAIKPPRQDANRRITTSIHRAFGRCLLQSKSMPRRAIAANADINSIDCLSTCRPLASR